MSACQTLGGRRRCSSSSSTQQTMKKSSENDRAKCHTPPRLLKSVIRASGGGRAARRGGRKCFRKCDMNNSYIAGEIHIACACVPACIRCSGWHSLLQTAYINTVGRGRSVRSHVDYISLHGRKSQSCPRARPRRKRERGRERAFSISRSGILKLLPCSGTNSIRFTAAENEQGMEG